MIESFQTDVRCKTLFPDAVPALVTFCFTRGESARGGPYIPDEYDIDSVIVNMDDISDRMTTRELQAVVDKCADHIDEMRREAAEREV